MVGIEPAVVENVLKPIPSSKAHFLREVSGIALSVRSGRSTVLRRYVALVYFCMCVKGLRNLLIPSSAVEAMVLLFEDLVLFCRQVHFPLTILPTATWAVSYAKCVGLMRLVHRWGNPDCRSLGSVVCDSSLRSTVPCFHPLH